MTTLDLIVIVAAPWLLWAMVLLADHRTGRRTR